MKRITAPRAAEFTDRFAVYPESALEVVGETLFIDEDGDGAADYSTDRPDFDVRELNSTLVARWEYRPGSLLYLVWSQARDDETFRVGRGLPFGRGLGQAFDVPAHDVFLSSSAGGSSLLAGAARTCHPVA